MIIVLCQECKLGIRIIGNPAEVEHLVGKESEFWPSQYPCPSCNQHLKGQLEMRVSPATLTLYDLKELTPHEAFIAFNGMGLPEERSCRKQQVEELFQTPIRRVVGQDTSTNRFILEHIEFWDGTKLYLGAAPGGAVIYKISAPPQHTKEALSG